jgi:MFS family permease
MLAGVTGRLGVLGAVFRSPALRRLEGAYLLFAFGEWSTWVAIIVYAYGRGGAAEAGVVVFIQLAPSVVLAPALAGLGDRFRRDRVLLTTYLAQAACMVATATALVTGIDGVLVYSLATVTATLVAISRPVHSSLMPEVARSPDDLTAANVVSGMAESAGSLAGPLGAGLLIGYGGPAAVFAAAAVGCAIASLAVLDIPRQTIGGARSAVGVPARGGAFGPAEVDEPGGLAAPVVRPAASVAGELVGGLSAIVADPRLLAIVVIAAWGTFLVGAMDVLYAVLAIDLMGLDESAVGYVGALGGVGAIAGAAGALFLVGRERLGLALAASAILFGLAIGAVAIAPASAVAGLCLVLAGTGSGLTAVASQTLIQRLAGDDVMSRVFGVLQGLMMGATALGALTVPILIGLLDDRLAFVVAGLSLPVVVALAGRGLVRSDRLDPTRAAHLRLLRAVPMLGPLSGPVLERLAAGATRVPAVAHAAVIREGDRGDRFFVVVSGRLDVSVAGASVGSLGAGDAFGEIALLRDIPRTATITATEHGELLAIDRGPFLEALTGQTRSGTIATGIVDEHLAADLARP